LGDYSAFIDSKQHKGADHGFAPTFMPDQLFDFQKSLVDWSVYKGRDAIFADCGLGKTPMQLTWAENVARHTDKPVLVLTPLAVGYQTVKEGEKFGIECHRSQTGETQGRIIVSNYERLGYFNPADFGGVVLDESSILKSFDGATRHDITEFMKRVPYRLLATATAAPNDYIELGTSSEALGYMGHMDMLNRFFKNDNNNSGLKRMYGEAPKWRFKGHSEIHFWRWVTSWARACRKPSDLGFDDGPFVLPPLIENTHDVDPETAPPGSLFTVPAVRLDEQREEKRRTINERCERVAELTSNTGKPALVWCHLNDEGDLLERLIPGAVQVSGANSDKVKEDRLRAFADGQIRVLVTKPKIGAWGLNFQHCAHITMFPSHSFEQYYQAVRRCWRFGQTQPVVVDIIATEGEKIVLANLKRKAEAADKMFTTLVQEMTNASAPQFKTSYETREMIPTWL
jgi:hypothetical protein